MEKPRSQKRDLGHPPGKETAGPSTTLRSGRDDNSVAGARYLALKL
jgi:hypothetical protein